MSKITYEGHFYHSDEEIIERHMTKSTTINVWHGMGHVTACVSHDGGKGDATSSSIDFSFEGSSFSIFIKGRWIDWVEEFSIQFYGSAERWGFANLLKAAGEELGKPVDQLGRNFAIDYDSLMYEADYPSISKKGLIGETALNDWFKTTGISYLDINQS